MNGIQYDVELQMYHKRYDEDGKIAFSIFFDAKKDVASCIFKGLMID